MPPNRYRAKPGEVDAVHFDGSPASVVAVMRLVDASRGTTIIGIEAGPDHAKRRIEIPTPDAPCWADVGDWILRNAQGALWVLDATLFAATYEATAPS
ncbi:hypothetical protein ABZ883_04740 [Streptomyces sp. NPDC046977]|uniref:hypothetical protein n=1 Tax=Streptomyces sp. NPDC046977 TaxID=3154703 RepID=UPI0033F5FC80